MKKVFILIIILAFSLPIDASIDTENFWKAVTIETTSGNKVEIRINPDNWEVDFFKLTSHGEEFEVSGLWLEDMPYIDLNTIQLFSGCSIFSIGGGGSDFTIGGESDDEAELEWSSSCSTSVRVKAEHEIEEEKRPPWYERAEISFVFRDGHLVYRVIKRKVGKAKWRKDVLDADDLSQT